MPRLTARMKSNRPTWEWTLKNGRRGKFSEVVSRNQEWTKIRLTSHSSSWSGGQSVRLQEGAHDANLP
eukprot:427045-Hanusia_phi.AAC.2